MAHIAILGGGLTGLTAALKLTNEGHTVTIYEKAPFVGGLASGFLMQGEHLEKTYHHIFKTDTDIIDFASEIGIGDSLEWHESSVSIYYGGKLYPFSTPVDLIRFKPLSFVNRIRAGLVVLYLQRAKGWKDFTKVSAYSWMMKWAGKGVCKVIWEPLLKGKFDTYYDKVSMAWLYARLHIRANSRQPGDSKEMLGYFNGGFDIIIERLKTLLAEKNVTILTEAQVDAIESNPQNHMPCLKINGEEVLYDKIIATTPSYIFAKLIEHAEHVDAKYVEKLTSIPYLGAICAVFSSDQNIGDFYWNNINDLESPFLVFINHTKLIDKERYGGKYVYYIGVYLPHEHEYFAKDEAEIYTIWFEYLKKMFPDFDESKVIDRNMFKLKNAQHIVGLNYEKNIPDYRTPVPGVYLSNFSQIFPEDRGTNYAVREGKKIAELVLRDLK